MKLPKKLIIFGKTYTLKKERMGYAGLCDKEERIISICPSQKDSYEILHTLIHEIAHATWHENSIGQTSLHGDVEEIMANSIATIILDNFNLSIKKELFNDREES